MVLRDKVMESWHLYAHTRARKRTAVLRFAQGVGRAEMRLLEQQHQQQEQQQHNTGENQHTRTSNVRTANSATSAANSATFAAHPATTAAPTACLERAARARRHVHESLRDHVAETIALMARRAAGITNLSKETYTCEKRLMQIDFEKRLIKETYKRYLLTENQTSARALMARQDAGTTHLSKETNTYEKRRMKRDL